MHGIFAVAVRDIRLRGVVTLRGGRPPDPHISTCNRVEALYGSRERARAAGVRPQQFRALSGQAALAGEAALAHLLPQM